MVGQNWSGTGARWDVVEEHLDEAAFLFDVWTAALASHDHVLDEVAAGPEERLLAHLGGLATAGPEAAERLLHPALASGEAGAAFAAAFVLSQAGDPELAAIVDAAQQASSEARAAIARALAIAPDAGLTARLASRLERASPPESALLLATLAARGETPPAPRVRELLRTGEGGVLLDALAAARALPAADVRPEVERLLASADPAVAVRAVEAGLLLGLAAAWERCLELAGAPGPAWAAAALLRALAGDAAAVAPLREGLADPARRPAALLALGYSGRVDAAEAALAHLADPAVGPLAAEAFSAVTGLRLDPPYAAARLVDDGPDDEADDEPVDDDPAVARLPVPDPHAIAGWWAAEQRRFERGQRYLRGAPSSADALWRELAAGPTRRRAALALELGIRTGGHAQIDVLALAARQRAALERARVLLPRASTGDFHRLAVISVPRAGGGETDRVRAAAAEPADVVVTGLGLATPLGLSAASAFAAVRAGVARMEEQPALFLCAPGDARFEAPSAVVACSVPEPEAALRDERRAAEWLGWLAGLALRDAEREAGLQGVAAARLGLFLAVPADASAPAIDLDEVSYHLHNHARRDLLPNVRVRRCGSAGGFALVEDAVRALRGRELDAALVVGADSRLFPRMLRALDGQDRLKCGRHARGFLPGEAGGALVLELSARAVARGRRARAVLRSTAADRTEPGPLPETGVALARLLERLLAGTASPPVIVCDLNGEHARMREWGYAVSRLGTKLPPPVALEHPALMLGDVGAASGSVLLAHAVQLLETKYSGHGAALAWAASDDGERRGVLLERC